MSDGLLLRARETYVRNKRDAALIRELADALETERGKLTDLRQCVLDLCARLDVTGEKADLGGPEHPAMNYFTTVSINIGMARVAIEHDIGPDYYAERYALYKREDAEFAAARSAPRKG